LSDTEELDLPAAPFLPADRRDGGGGPLSLARLARAAGAEEEAVARYREALLLDPGDPTAAVEAALYLATLGRPRDAVELLELCVRRHPEHPAARFHLGLLWGDLGEPAKAAQHLNRCLGLDPDDRLGADAALAAMAQAAGGLTATYVRALFDQYAEDFDRNLIEDLRYRAPEILRQALDRCWRPPAGGADAVDLGCGTGLAAPMFRDIAKRLHGVDLSPRMVQKAAARRIYDGLAVGDAVAALHGQPACWDLVIAADMLVYLDDLGPLLAAVAASLRPGGAFVATAEATDMPHPELKPTRRFGHPTGHLRHAAIVAGLRVALLEPAATRTEKGQPVPGHVMVALKDARPEFR
jgi:predicted TPR repeat methyltransferase